jgi:hypothetical protein
MENTMAYAIQAVYEDERHGDTFVSYIDTENVVYADKLAAELTADLLNEMNRTHDLDLFIGIHSTSYPIKFFVEPLTVM